MTRFITRLYPRAWRERYGAELSELIDETGMTPRVAIDVVRGAAREWTSQARLGLAGGGSMVIGPAWRNPGMWAVSALVVLAPTAIFVLLSILAYQLGATELVGLMEPVNRWLNGMRVLDLLVVASPVVALLLAVAPLVRIELKTSDSGREAVLGLRLKLANVLIGLLALLIGGLLVGHIVLESVLEAGA
jgi:hypothetical protein